MDRVNWCRLNRQREDLIINGRRQPSHGGTSRMMREYHVRICEGLGVQLPGSTRRVSRVSPVHLCNYTRDEGGPFEVGNQVLISSHRELLWSKAMVVNVAEKSGHDPVRHGRERRA